MITNVARTCAAGVLAATVVVLSGCSGSSGPQKVVTVTVPPSSPAVPSGSASGSSGSAGATPSTSGSATAAADQTKLPGDCDSLLPDYPVAQAIGKYAFTGSDGFIVGIPDKSIGRLATINCRYGVTGTGANAVAKLEIGVSLYKTAAQASARVTATVSDYSAHGASATPTTVSGQPAQLVTGGAGADYREPLLVLAVGQRTFAISVSSAIATGSAVATDAVKVAALAVQKTAG